jgi:hypothetical protein
MKRKTILVIIWVVSLFPFTLLALNEKYSLDNSNSMIKWEVKPVADVKESGFEVSTPGYKMKDAVEGVVPGTVFTAYVEAGLEKDPNYADNIYRVDESYYNRPFWYRTEFDAPMTVKKNEKIWLHFTNTNRYADFYFNGKKLSGTETSTKDVSGHMLRSRFDVTDLMNESGKNTIAVLIYDANQKKRRDSNEAFGVAASPTYLAAAGWDWMPYVPGRLHGITGKVYLEKTGTVIMEDPWIRSELESNKIAYLAFETAVNNTSNDRKDATVSIYVQPSNIKVSKNVSLDPGETGKVYMNRKEFEELIIKNPKLWWPNGYGDPHLYTCKVTCEVEGKITDEKEITFGIRQYEYRFERNNAGWPVMTFYINGQKLFIKGGNWGMSEYLLRTSDKEYEKKIRLHKDMNYNMIRLWTGCVTDDAFYDYCDRYGIMVWDDFWLYVAYNEVDDYSHFKQNALDKVRRLRNHPSIALWCGANETHPAPELDHYLREIIAREDHNDRMYKSSSNQDGLSGSGWWGNKPPKHHFENSGSNLAWNNPPYPYGDDRGYGMRTEIGTATFPVYESVKMFIPEDQLWPLPNDEQLMNDNENVWNRHFFGKEASNATPVNYKRSVNEQFGESNNLEAFCEKAQFLNIEVVKGMYEAWNDKMWNDATGILIWMSQSAYPSFVWQTYDYYYDASGSYWGAKKGCEPLHIQWNSSSNSVKVINSTSNDLKHATATARVFTLQGVELSMYGRSVTVDVPSANAKEVFQLNMNPFNLAYGKEFAASSEMAPHEVSLAGDGGAGSRWESEYSDPQWIQVDLGDPLVIQRVILKWENAFAEEYKVQVSNDTVKWITVAQVKEGDGGTDEIEFDPVEARYVRVSCSKRATDFGYSIYEFEVYGEEHSQDTITPLHFIRLELKDAEGCLITDNFYWRNGKEDLNYTDLNKLPEAELSINVTGKSVDEEINKTVIELKVKNNSTTVAFGNRLRLVNRETGDRVLPVLMNDNYFTLMPGEEKTIQIEANLEQCKGGVDLLHKQYNQPERKKVSFNF